MKKESLKTHLKQYLILSKRKTTINHAFASAIAKHEKYDEIRVSKAIQALGQDSNEDLKCVYCDKPAETWDHLFGLVRDKKYAGYGHVIGNLVPCCKTCNSKKGNKDWKEFLKSTGRLEKIEPLQAFLEAFLPLKMDEDEIAKLLPSEMQEYTEIKEEIFGMMEKADDIASKIRIKVEKYKNTTPD